MTCKWNKHVNNLCDVVTVLSHCYAVLFMVLFVLYTDCPQGHTGLCKELSHNYINSGKPGKFTVLQTAMQKWSNCYANG